MATTNNRLQETPSQLIQTPIDAANEGTEIAATSEFRQRILSADNDYLKFYTNILNNAFSTIAIKAFWTVQFMIPRNGILEKIFKDYTQRVVDYNSDPIVWEINNSTNLILTKLFVVADHKFMVQAVKIPGDSVNYEDTDSPRNTGYLKGKRGNGRKPYEDLTISFFENNISVADMFIRPWIALIGYNSLKNPDFKTEIHAIFYQKSPDGFKERKKIKFYQCAPVSVDSEDYDYVFNSAVPTRVTSWIYNYYTVEDGEAINTNNSLNSNTFQRIVNDTVISLTEKDRFQGEQKLPFEQLVSNIVENTATTTYPKLRVPEIPTKDIGMFNKWQERVLTDLKNYGASLAQQALGEAKGAFGGTVGKVLDATVGGNIVSDLMSGNIGLNNLQIPFLSDTPSPLEVYGKSEISSNSIKKLINGEESDIPVPLQSDDIRVTTSRISNNLGDDKRINNNDIANAIRSSDAANSAKDIPNIMNISDNKSPTNDIPKLDYIREKSISPSDIPNYSNLPPERYTLDTNTDTPVYLAGLKDNTAGNPFNDNPGPNFKIINKTINQNDTVSNTLKISNKDLNKDDYVKVVVTKDITINKVDTVIK